MVEKLVTLTTFTYTTEAYILVAKLEAEGITTFLRNEHLLSTQQFLSNAVGGLDVQVEEKELEKAKIILKKMGENNSTATDLPVGITKEYEKVLSLLPGM